MFKDIKPRIPKNYAHGRYYDMEAKLINIDEWRLVGEGGVGKSYVNLEDDSLFLKLNNTAVCREHAELEYLNSKRFCTLGLPTPGIYDFVTDGTRYGYTGEFLKGKKSFASIMAGNPSCIDQMACRFAQKTRELHNTMVDTSNSQDLMTLKREYLGDMSFVPKDVADVVSGYFDCIEQGYSCLLSDLNPGNLILYQGKEYWIDTGASSYGNPIIDFASMYMVLHFMPLNMSKDLFHLNHRQFRLFYTKVLQYYYGKAEIDADIMDKIRKVALINCCSAIRFQPSSAPLFIPLLRNQTLRFEAIRILASLKRHNK